MIKTLLEFPKSAPELVLRAALFTKNSSPSVDDLLPLPDRRFRPTAGVKLCKKGSKLAAEVKPGKPRNATQRG